ncbi:hypothetical protein [Siphonobacter sp. SORGH_AS_0500]|uniref:hypothetical protein n=1 Tax=Siphonobacter sp. SORGH_AS_0500 TaxID=1864824 RepID=UPI00285D1689|nr:hypothetical protein [Siphonobacter sp. SORGH_AS_0500]MDR6194724.1 uncharacterized protein with HEPN domain [Siphonobacter sp. SORGH_AS_0500]
MKASLRNRLSSIMHKAWTLFRNGIVSFSLSLKLAWKIDKNQIPRKHRERLRQLLKP